MIPCYLRNRRWICQDDISASKDEVNESTCFSLFALLITHFSYHFLPLFRPCKMLKAAFLLALSSLTAASPLLSGPGSDQLAFNAPVEPDTLGSGSKVNVTLYVMSRCPDAVRGTPSVAHRVGVVLTVISAYVKAYSTMCSRRRECRTRYSSTWAISLSESRCTVPAAVQRLK